MLLLLRPCVMQFKLIYVQSLFTTQTDVTRDIPRVWNIPRAWSFSPYPYFSLSPSHPKFCDSTYIEQAHMFKVGIRFSWGGESALRRRLGEQRTCSPHAYIASNTRNPISAAVVRYHLCQCSNSTELSDRILSPQSEANLEILKKTLQKRGNRREKEKQWCSVRRSFL